MVFEVLVPGVRSEPSFIAVFRRCRLEAMLVGVLYPSFVGVVQDDQCVISEMALQDSVRRVVCLAPLEFVARELWQGWVLRPWVYCCEVQVSN